jgi:sRNA-binding carbon storage regulator CsrA
MGDSVLLKYPGGEITVTYLSQQGPTGTEIRIGFDAPNDVNIVRSEILDRYPDKKEKVNGS